MAPQSSFPSPFIRHWVEYVITDHFCAVVKSELSLLSVESINSGNIFSIDIRCKFQPLQFQFDYFQNLPIIAITFDDKGINMWCDNVYILEF